MADFKVPNLCGASPEFNAIQTKFESMITSALDGLEGEASTLKTTLDTNVNGLVRDLKAMIPELPALPDINLQAQLTSLSGLSFGSGLYNSLLADITTKFGSALTTNGFDLDTLVLAAAEAITGGTDLCSAVPNFTVPAAGGDAVEKAVDVLQPVVDSLPEKASTLLANANFADAQTALAAAINSPITNATDQFTKISVSDNKGNIKIEELATALDSIVEGVRANFSEGASFSSRPVWTGGVKSFDNYDPRWVKALT